MKLFRILLLASVFMTFSLPLIAQSVGEAQKTLEEAHQSFLDKKYRKAAKGLKKVFEKNPGSAAIEDNALKLLKQMHQERGAKKIPTDWDLPQEISYLKVGFRKKEGLGFKKYRITLSGTITSPGELESIILEKHPQRIILNTADKKSGLEFWEEDGIKEFYLGRSFESIQFDGLYSIKIKLKGKAQINGWFIAESMESTLTPSISSPGHKAILQNRTPVLSWSDFKSPEFEEFEKRRLSVRVTKADNDWTEVWSYKEKVPQTQSLVLGEKGKGVNKLESDAYYFSVTYSERRRFGPITLSRESRKTVPFSIQ